MALRSEQLSFLVLLPPKWSWTCLSIALSSQQVVPLPSWIFVGFSCLGSYYCLSWRHQTRPPPLCSQSHHYTYWCLIFCFSLLPGSSSFRSIIFTVSSSLLRKCCLLSFLPWKPLFFQASCPSTHRLRRYHSLSLWFLQCFSYRDPHLLRICLSLANPMTFTRPQLIPRTFVPTCPSWSAFFPQDHTLSFAEPSAHWVPPQLLGTFLGAPHSLQVCWVVLSLGWVCAEYQARWETHCHFCICILLAHLWCPSRFLRINLPQLRVIFLIASLVPDLLQNWGHFRAYRDTFPWVLPWRVGDADSAWFLRTYSLSLSAHCQAFLRRQDI